MRLYVGNLGFVMTDVQLQALFAEHGSVNSAKVIRDHDSGQGRGFGFVEMPDVEAQRAMESLNGKTIEGRALTVNEARPTRHNSDGRGRGSSEKRGFGQYGRH